VEVFQNGAHVNVENTILKWSSAKKWFPNDVSVQFIQLSIETGYYGRFMVPLTAHATTDAYFVVADDDLLWGSHYLESMIRVVNDGYLATRNGRIKNTVTWFG